MSNNSCVFVAKEDLQKDNPVTEAYIVSKQVVLYRDISESGSFYILYLYLKKVSPNLKLQSTKSISQSH